jgi:serine protease
MTEAAAQALSDDQHVVLVEQDSVAVPTAVQTGSPVYWGLDRIDSRPPGPSYSYTYNRTGAGVRIYIVDSGISNNDGWLYPYPGRLVNGFTVHYWNGNQNFPIYEDVYCYEEFKCHGSKVASIAAGSLYGVAKEATIVNVKVLTLNRSQAIVSTVSNMIAGLNFVVQDHNVHPNEPAVVNFSMTLLGDQPFFNQTVINVIDYGVVFVCGAAQDYLQAYFEPHIPPAGDDACNHSPGRLGSAFLATNFYTNPHGRTAITVGASTQQDSRVYNAVSEVGPNWTTYWTSNYGSCVSLFAPGGAVAALGGAYPNEFAGTSAASPYVAGVVALYLEGRGSNYDPNTVKAALLANATANALSNIGPASPNLLVYSRVDLWP